MNPDLTGTGMSKRVVRREEDGKGSPNKANPGTGKKTPVKKTATRRDHLVMEWIGINGVASLKQLQLVFWPEASESSCQRRLLALEREGWIKRHYVDTSRKLHEQVYSLTQSGARNHFDPATRHFLMIGLPPLSQLKQQLTAQDTRIVLGQLLAAQGKRVFAWINERELRGKAVLSRRKGRKWTAAGMALADIPDARVVIETQPATLTANLNEMLGSLSSFDFPSFNNTANDTALPHGVDAAANETKGAYQVLEVEIDGQYYGQMLKIKITSLARRNRPTLWVTSSYRAVQVQDEINRLGANNIRVLAVDPILEEARADLPFGRGRS